MNTIEEDYIYSEETSRIIGACFEVHNTLGNGFLESVYQEALMIELYKQNIPFITEQKLDIWYKEDRLTKFFTADFVCYDKIILELKAADAITDDHIGQVINYLKATNFKLGLLLNFGAPKLQIKRLIR
jgi:GxxExxY protein